MMPKRAAVATPHPQAALAARDVLLEGGNAIDAAVADMMTLCVVQSHQVGLGGYGGNFVAYLAKETRMVAIDFDSRAPLEFREETFADPRDRETSYLSITVPAVLAGLDLVLQTYGTMSWKRIAKHAIQMAEEGFPTDPTTRLFLERWLQKTDPDSRKAFFAGDIPQTGQPWVQKELGQLIRRIANEGPQVFYNGDIAEKIVKHIRAHGGILSIEDFAEYRPQIVEPVTASYRGHDVYTPPPPAGGITSLQILKTLEQFDIGSMEPWGASYLHVLAQAAKLCWQDRIRALGDPDVIDIPIAELLSDKSAIARAKKIRTGPIGPTQAIAEKGPHTANMTCVDTSGNVASMTATQGFVFGSQVVIPGLGLVMAHGMSRFDFEKGHPNAPAPGKRMQHNMAPTIVLHNGQPRFAMGMPGGTKIITVTAQLIVDFVDFYTSAQQTVDAPRIHTEGDEPVAVSSRITDQTIEQLKKLGHKVVRGQTVGGLPNEIAGFANAMSIDPKTGEPAVASQAGPEAALVV